MYYEIGLTPFLTPFFLKGLPQCDLYLCLAVYLQDLYGKWSLLYAWGLCTGFLSR